LSIIARVAGFFMAVVFVTSCSSTSSSLTTDPVDTSVIKVVATDSTVNPADGLVEITVTVGIDSGADRIVQIPLGADEYHLHGYNIASGSEVPAGEMAVIEFEATKSGSFEIESHASQQVLIFLEIS